MDELNEFRPATARHRLVVEMLRRIRVAQGDRNPSGTMLLVQAEAAHKVWKWIADGDLPKAVERAIYVFGARNVTPERVREAHQRPSMRPSAEERERRRRAAQERQEREAPPPDVAAAFFGEMAEKLKGD